MQVYANSFRIEGKDAFRAAIGAIHGWLKQVMELQFGLHEITRDNELSNDKNELRPWLRVYVSVDETPKLYAWRLKHLDKAVFGRQWIVELGLKVEQNAIDLSCSVLTEEQSTLVREPIEATRPRVIAYVLENVATSEDAHIAHDVPGTKIKLAGKHPEDYRALRMEIERQERDYPLVLVSPTREGTYLINREHLQDALFGLAQVVELLPTYDRYEMEEELGKQWSAWDGALNIIQTQRSSGRIFGVVLRSDEIEMLGDKQASRVSHVLARVTHNTNVPRLRNRIRPEGVQQLALRRRLEKRRAESSKDPVALEQEINALWQEIELLEDNNRKIQQNYDMAEMARMELEDQNQELESKLRNLQYKTNALESRSSAVNDTSMDSEYFVAFAARPDQPSTEECLELISRAFPNRCEILDTAWKSARDMSTFQSGRRLLDMLRRLMTEYIDAIQEGGDNHARLVFSADEYSAQESETVMNNHALSEKRKFVRKGQTLEMFRHLKIGKADNVSHTLRVHFAWLPDERKIVIGHCGEHLPISSH